MDSGILNIKKLTAPINNSAPVGNDLRIDGNPNSVYYQIKDARMSARMMERKYFDEHNDSLKKEIQEAWQIVYQQSLYVLQTTSKDLEVMTWLIEALFRLQGFKGLALGFELATELIKTYWPDIFPEEDEEGPSSKVIALASLNGIDAEGVLEMPIHCVALTDGQLTDKYALWQYKQSLEVEPINNPDKKQKRYAQGVIPLDKIKKAAEQSGEAFYKSLHENVEHASQAYHALCEAIEEKSPNLHFPSSTLQKLFNEVKELIGYLFEKRQVITNEIKAAPDKKAKKPPVIVSNTKFYNREEALEQLLAIANYFREAEPQSLLPYLLERANRWGKLPLPELLGEIINDERARESLFGLTGIARHVKVEV